MTNIQQGTIHVTLSASKAVNVKALAIVEKLLADSPFTVESLSYHNSTTLELVAGGADEAKTEETPAARKKRVAAEKRAAQKAEKAGEVVDDDPLGLGADDDPLADADTEEKELTVDDVKAAGAKVVDRAGGDAVRAVFQTFGAKGLAKLKPKHFAACIKALNAVPATEDE